ncbi:hypothetical protein FHS27_001340 [Rhodopirellula rubra]|uniref:Uncharacterized protein n=1 Tax=Aporhodopirellula rubra TaxID=980271 RepID=A0A7W5H541_9BACT|nr:hypothetical protein [Aporhodopirellula rubra]MBB3205540.1 hypothetical protein [Aporhodopirellula rubra]
MILGIATVVVLVLVAVALLPAKKRDRDSGNLNFTQPFARQANFRQQQLNEEAEAIADEYQRRADEAWRDELGEKAATLLKSKPASTLRSTKS